MFPFTVQETVIILALAGIVVAIALAITGIGEMIEKRIKKS